MHRPLFIMYTKSKDLDLIPMKKHILGDVKNITFDSGSAYETFRKKYGEDPREYISTTFNKNDLLAMMQLPYAREVFKNKEEMEKFVAGAHLYDIAVKIIDECFTPENLLRAVEEVSRRNPPHVKDIDEHIFTKVFGKESQDFFEEDLSRDDVIAIINHPDILMRYCTSKADHNRLVQSMNKDDLIADILGEGFDTDVLIRVVKEVLVKGND